MAEAAFLAGAAPFLTGVRTWFNSEFANIVQQPRTNYVPLQSGPLDPLYASGLSTLGNCRVTCATARLVELDGLATSTAQSAGTHAQFRACGKAPSVLITVPVTMTLSAKLMYYAVNQDIGSSATTVIAATGTGSLLITAPMWSAGNVNTFRFDHAGVSFNMSVAFTAPTVDAALQTYVSGALSEQASVFLQGLRNTLDAVNLLPSMKQSLGPQGTNVMTPLTLTFALPAPTSQLAPPSCELTAPCDPCDKCCVCVAQQICSDACAGCPCMNCESASSVSTIAFYALVLIIAASGVALWLRR